MISAQKVFARSIHFFIIVSVGLIIYSNTFYSPFQWDETYFIVGNPAVKDLAYFLDPEPVQGMSVYGFKNRFVGYLTFALNYKIHGFDVFGYHIVNLVIHLTNAILVYFFVLLTLRTPYFGGPGTRDRGPETGNQIFVESPVTSHQSRITAFIVALLFVAHPVQTEAVTYVFQRFTSLVSLFYLMSLVLYIKGRQIQVEVEAKVKVEKNANSTLRPNSSALTLICFLLSFLSAVLAMKTKENAFTLPVVIALYEFLFFSGSMKTRTLILLPFIATMIIIPINIVRIEGSFGEILEPMTEPTAFGNDNLTRWEYLYTQFRVIITYIRLLFLPLDQNVVYDYPVYRSFFDLPVFISFLFLTALFGAAVYLVYKSQSAKCREHSEKGNGQSTVSSSSMPCAPCAMRLVAFGILWFFITLSVESSIVPLALVIDEYRIYLPSIGLFLALAGAGMLLTQKFPNHARLAGTGFAVILLVLASATYARNTLWEDKVSLWEDVASKNHNSPKVYNNLGIAYYEKGLYEKAVKMYERAISLSPDNFFAYSNMGAAYASMRRFDRAVENFTKAIALDPGNSVVYANLARTFRRLGRFNEAAENYRKAVELNPYDSMAFYGMGSTYMILGQLEEALAAYTRFVELSPQDPEAYRSRGTVYARKSNLRMAAEDFSKACSLGSAESCEYVRKAR